jgi:hypothetical protein
MEFNICIDYVPISSFAGRYLFTEEGKKKSLSNVSYDVKQMSKIAQDCALHC